MDWSIITLTVPERAAQFEELRRELARQIGSHDTTVEHVVVSGGGTIGEKIRRGYERSSGWYVSVVDDDDWVAPDYVDRLHPLKGERSDVITFGYATPGCVPCWLRTNVKDNYKMEPDGSNVKAANHLCLWRRELALASPCLPRNYAWDYVWYTCLNKGFPSLSERHVREVLYEYRYSAEGTLAQCRPSIDSSLSDGGNNILCCKHRASGRLLAGKGYDRLQRPDGTTENFAGRVGELELLEDVWFR